MNIVKMEKSHTSELARLEELCFSRPWSEAALAEEIENENACFLTAVEDGTVLGYCGMHCACGECYIDNVAVFPKYRGKGIATALMTALKAEAKARGGEFVSLEVRASNTNAVSLYEKLGFCTVGRRKNFYADPVEDALIMTHNFEC